MTRENCSLLERKNAAHSDNKLMTLMKHALWVVILAVFFCHLAAAQTGPTISGLLVNGVPSDIGPVNATLTIQGNGFGNSIGFSVATLNGTALAGNGVKPISWSNTSIVAVIPEAASSGPVIVTLLNEPPSNSVSFSIGAVITGLSATSGLAGTGVTIRGQGFGTSGGAVAFNGTAAAYTGWTDASILATVPTGATEGPIVVTVGGQSSNGSVTFTPTPSISALSTNFGVAGTAVTISGNSFGNSQVSGSTVTFNGVVASVGAWTNNSISVTAPSGATTGSVVVSVNGIPSAGVMFTYTPSITSLYPIPVLADGNITIGGNNFGSPLPTDVVTFNGIAATVNSWANTSIGAVVPGGVSAGQVIVSVNGVSSAGFSFSLTSPYNFSLSYAPDGDVLTVNDNVNGNWVYAYDNFNRLACSNLSSNGSCAQPTSGVATYTYAYDQYGNRAQQNGPLTVHLTFSNSQNHMDGYSYDAAGNLSYDGYHNYIYDAENRITQVDPGPSGQPPAYAYAYDGEGQRIQKASAGTLVAQYLHDLAGNTVTELNGSGVWTRSEIYAGGRHLATYGGGASGTTYFVQRDWLGTERARVLPDGDVAETCTSLPFGDGQTCSGVADPTPDHFTGKERDTESGLDNFGKRYHASTMGRFMTPDPIGIMKQKLRDPQQWNMYSYSRNSPLRFMDPTGMYVADCGSGVKNCNKQIQNLDKSLQNALKSKDQNIVKAAQAYGALGDANGVNVSIVKVVDPNHKDVAGVTTEKAGSGGYTVDPATGKVQQATQVNIRAGMSGNQLEETAVHEGVHVEDRANFVNSITTPTTFDRSLNITGRQSERNAYGVENEWLRQGNMPTRNIDDILSHPPYSDNPNIDRPLFPNIPGPE
jgi:RHS repeat-associated protein